jgi:hypothetical protein
MSSIDAEDLNARLSGGLAPANRTAFRKAAEAALATSPECSGEGSTSVITKLWRSYFRPPTDTGDNGWYENHERPASKLLSDGPPARRARGLRIVE